MPKQDKKTSTALVADLDVLVQQYGFDTFRRVANRYLKTRRLQAKARRDIAALEAQLERLKQKVG